MINTNDYSRYFKIFVLFVFLVFGILLFFFLFSFGRLVVVVDSPSGSSVKVLNQANGEEVASTTSGSMNKILRSGKYQIIAFSEDEKSSAYFVTVRRFFLGTKTQVEFQNQNEREKVARNVERCVFYSKGVLYSSPCSSSEELYQHTTSSPSGFSKKEQLFFDYLLSVKPYKNGLLALRLSDEVEESGAVPEIIYIEDKKVIQRVSLPSGFISNEEDFVLRTEANSNSFIVGVNKNSKIASYTSLNSSPKIIVPEEKTTINPTFLTTSIDLYKGQIIYKIGQDTSSPDSEEETSVRQKKQNTLLMIYDANSGSIINKTEIKYPIDTASFCGDNIVCVTDEQKITLLEIKNNKNRGLLSINNAQEYVFDPDQGIYYVQDGNVYLLNSNDGSARSVFQSKNFKVSDLYFSSSGLLITATNDNKSHGFVLGQISKTNTFVDNILPYPVGFNNIVLDSDYGKSGLLVKLALESWQSDRTGSLNFTYDKKEFDSKRRVILERIKSDLSNNSIKINVIP